MGTLCWCFSEEVLWLFPGPACDKVTLREEDAGHPLPEQCQQVRGDTKGTGAKISWKLWVVFYL